MSKKIKSIKHKFGLLEGWLSISINLFLFVIKFWAGIVSGSVALIADAWHTLSDSISSAIVILGVSVSARDADDEHPFGHGRAELIASITVSVLLAIIAINFTYESILKLIDGETANFGIIAIVVTIVSIIIKEAMAQFAFWAAKKSGMVLLKADAWHHRTDAISSVIILVGIIFADYFWWIDGVLGLAVALLIFYTAYEIFKDSASPILGENISDEMISEIKNICQKNGLGHDVPHHFHIHHYGDHAELTFHIKFEPNISLHEAHEIATNIENEIRIKLLIESTIHLEPINK